jgi:hypothetical protein
MPEVVAPKSAPVTGDPYGLGQVRNTGPITVPAMTEHASGGSRFSLDNRVAWTSLLFGLVAVGLTLAPSLPGSPLWWVASAAVVSLVTGVVAVAGRVAGTSSNVVAPVVGVVLAAAATAMIVTGVGIFGLINSAAAAIEPAAAATPSSAALAPVSSVEPLVFPANQDLTASGQTLQQVATALNTTFAGGNSSLAAGQAWPASITFTDTQVLAADGTVLATIPSGHVLTYKLAADGKSYLLSVSGSNPSQVSIYDSATNRFSFRCLATDTTCTPAQ